MAARHGYSPTKGFHQLEGLLGLQAVRDVSGEGSPSERHRLVPVPAFGDVLDVRSALHARFGNIDFDRIPRQGIGIEHADGLICVSL